MNICYICGENAFFAKINGGLYVCRVCIANDKDLESELKEWVEDRQLNGDDGSGFNDYEQESEN